MGSNSTYDNPTVQYDSASWLITAVGVLLGISGITYIVTHPEPAIVWVTELALVSIPSAAIVYGGYWIAANHVPQEDGRNIAKWCVLGAVVAALPLFGYIRAEQIGGEAVINSELLVILGALGGGVVALFAAISNERYHLDIATSTHDDVQLISVDSEPFSTEAQTLAKLVLDTRSWHVIQLLQLAEKPLGVESIAGRIASIENTDRQDVYIDLVHKHLPKLADEGLLYYDSDVEIVKLSDRIDAVANANSEISEASRQLEEIEQ